MEFLGLPWGEEEERVIMDRKKSWSLDGLSNSVLPLTTYPGKVARAGWRQVPPALPQGLEEPHSGG